MKINKIADCVIFALSGENGQYRIETGSAVYTEIGECSWNTNHRFASAVAAYGMLLRQSEFLQHASFRMVLNIGENALGEDVNGYRKEFHEMTRKTMRIARKEDAAYTR